MFLFTDEPMYTYLSKILQFMPRTYPIFGLFFNKNLGILGQINWEITSAVCCGVVTVLHLFCKLDLGKLKLSWLMGRRISNLNSEYMMEQISSIEPMDHLLLLLLSSKGLLLSGLKVCQFLFLVLCIYACLILTN